MRQRLALREGELMQIELAFEHDGDDLTGGGWLFSASFNHFGQALLMMLMKLPDALVQAGEGFAVAGQGEGVGMQGREAVDGL